MLIKKIVLKNIRTYIEEEINFEDSSILLSGDIGSGKSSILLAIEFALFGLARGKLSGDSLLRKGANECSVKLYFDIDENEYCIRRALKKGSVGISQVPGYIITNGIKEEGTAVELKSKIIDILGYPSALKKTIGSSKHFLIFRYTVYTPQEEMKNIILDSENRLDVLRDVFNIDKYKLIKKNSDNFLRKLDKEIYGQEIETNRIPDKVKEKEEIDKNKQNVNGEMILLTEGLNKIIQNKLFFENNQKEMEVQIAEVNKTKQEFAVKDNELKSIIREINNNNEQIESLKRKIQEVEKDMISSKVVDERDLDFKRRKLNDEIKILETREFERKEKLAVLRSGVTTSDDLIKKIDSLDHCPLCLQDVTQDHKRGVVNKEQEKIKNNSEEIEKLSSLSFDVTGKRKELETLDKLIHEHRISSLKRESVEGDKKRIEELLIKTSKLKQTVGKINEEKLALNTKIERFSEIEAKYSELKKKVDDVKSEEHGFNVKITELKTKTTFYDRDINKLNDEIEFLNQIKIKLNKNRAMRNWMKDHFLMLIDLIENHVLVKIQQEFDSHFQEWFNFLIEDENISGRLDEKFTPVVESDGYEISFMDLSGGEKTSVALAYRLALNKVINDFISTMKTKDFIILDEPTDGFSSEQLDKLKDVLDQINVKQIMIVSHETKIESFVDKVVRISKTDNVSQVV